MYSQQMVTFSLRNKSKKSTFFMCRKLHKTISLVLRASSDLKLNTLKSIKMKKMSLTKQMFR